MLRPFSDALADLLEEYGRAHLLGERVGGSEDNEIAALQKELAGLIKSKNSPLRRPFGIQIAADVNA